ncbi:hypothetical protein ACS0TY_013811 [Phlomoides rotata]
MKPVKEGDFFTVNIDEDIYQQGLDEFRDCLIGRIMISLGDKPYSNFELGKKLHEIWNVRGNLTLIPQSRGYYTIRFSNLEDRDRVWVRLTDLPMEYWQPGILDAMASALWSLIKIDDRTTYRRMGHYARILVEIDMRPELIEKIMYKRARVYSFANITYEHLPDFCRGCGIMGHTTATCFWGKWPDGKEPNERKCSTSGNRQRRSTSRRGRSTSR